MNVSDFNLDLLIRASAHSLLAEDIELFDSIDTTNTRLSGRTIRRINKKIKKHEKKSWWEAVPVACRRAVAAVLVACSVSFGLCMGVSAIRGEFVGAVLEWYDKFVSVFYVTEETPPSAIEEYREPRLQLAGSERMVIVQESTLYQTCYIADEEIAIVYQQMIITDTSKDVDNENGYKHEQINGFDAHLFSYDDGIRILTWHDNEYTYTITCYLTRIENQILFEIAESIK